MSPLSGAPGRLVPLVRFRLVRVAAILVSTAHHRRSSASACFLVGLCARPPAMLFCGACARACAFCRPPSFFRAVGRTEDAEITVVRHLCVLRTSASGHGEKNNFSPGPVRMTTLVSADVRFPRETRPVSLHSHVCRQTVLSPVLPRPVQTRRAVYLPLSLFLIRFGIEKYSLYCLTPASASCPAGGSSAPLLASYHV